MYLLFFFVLAKTSFTPGNNDIRKQSLTPLPISPNSNWQPVVIFYFDANRTGPEVVDGLLAFFEKYAACNISRYSLHISATETFPFAGTLTFSFHTETQENR